VSDPAAVIHGSRFAVPQGGNDVGVRRQLPIELGPALADGAREVGVRGAERRDIELRGEFAGSLRV